MRKTDLTLTSPSRPKLTTSPFRRSGMHLQGIIQLVGHRQEIMAPGNSPVSLQWAYTVRMIETHEVKVKWAADVFNSGTSSVTSCHRVRLTASGCIQCIGLYT